jgi:hypothetical protein
MNSIVELEGPFQEKYNTAEWVYIALLSWKDDDKLTKILKILHRKYKFKYIEAFKKCIFS